MPNIKTGKELPCDICGKMIYRCGAYIARGHRKHTCGSRECISASMRGEGNPFWGKAHDEQTRDKIKATKRARPTTKKTGPPKGYKHTFEALAKMSEAMRQRWADNRDVLIARLPRGIDHHYHKEPEKRRYRKEFTPLQRREWTADKCLWCETTENLTLDHIIPVFDGGMPVRENAQTLCHRCNLWKLHYVDKPRYLAGLGRKEGQI